MTWFNLTFFLLINSLTFVMRLNGISGTLLAGIELSSLLISILLQTIINRKILLPSLNSLILAWASVIVISILTSLVMGIISDSEYWLQVFVLNIRNLLIGIFGILIAQKIAVTYKNNIKVILLIVFFGYTQAIIGLITSYSLDVFLLVGVGVSYIALFSLVLALMVQSYLYKIVFISLSVAGNSLSAFITIVVGYFALNPIRSFLPILISGVFMALFLTGSFGEFQLFRKSPETIMSGTGRFLIYSECLEWISKLQMGGTVCHNSYLTLLSRNGFIGIIQVSILLAGSTYYYINILQKNLNITTFAPLFIIIFVFFNDFLTNTPSTLTLVFSYLLSNFKRGNVGQMKLSNHYA